MGFGFYALCFPETALVNVAGKGMVPMHMLQIGDQTLAYDSRSKTVQWSRVMSFLHREPEKFADYLTVSYQQANGAIGSITLSPDHMMYVVERGDMVPAGAAEVGEHMVLCDQSGGQSYVQITGAMTVQCRGVYAPLTTTGTIVVDNIAASCYVDVGYSHKAAHRAFKPLRMASGMNNNLAAGGSGDIHWYARGLAKIARV